MADKWTEAELRAAVRAYIGMREQLNSGKQFSKAEVYRALANQYERTESSFEYRMQNISHARSIFATVIRFQPSPSQSKHPTIKCKH